MSPRPSGHPNWAVSVLPMPPPLKRRPNFKPKPSPETTETPPARPEESQLSMAELILQNALQMSALAANPTSDFGRIYKELLNNLQQQQQQLQSSLFQSGLPYLDPALFLQSFSRVSCQPLLCLEQSFLVYSVHVQSVAVRGQTFKSLKSRVFSQIIIHHWTFVVSKV